MSIGKIPHVTDVGEFMEIISKYKITLAFNDKYALYKITGYFPGELTFMIKNLSDPLSKEKIIKLNRLLIGILITNKIKFDFVSNL